MAEQLPPRELLNPDFQVLFPSVIHPDTGALFLDLNHGGKQGYTEGFSSATTSITEFLEKMAIRGPNILQLLFSDERDLSKAKSKKYDFTVAAGNIYLQERNQPSAALC